MRKRNEKRFITGAVVLLLLIAMIPTNKEILAKETSENVSGRLYTFEEKSDYEYSSTTPTQNPLNNGKLGSFLITGNFKKIDNVNGFTAYQVQHVDVLDRQNDEGIVKLSYYLGVGLIGKPETEEHLTSDNGKKVDNLSLENKIGNATIIVQTSFDAKNWVTDVVKSDIADKDSGYETNFYKSKGVQQVNGCYYRVIVVYKTEKRLEDTKIGFVTQKHYEYKKYAEVYEFYLIDSLENSENAAKEDATPRKELGTKINTGKDNGYSGNEPITDKDPHLGWDIGTFYINGFTREQPVETNETPIFLKSVGDRVALWFNLEQNINELNGKSELSISEDKNGYDQRFGVPKTNFGRGTLIIKFTDFEGKTHDPIIYTDYLAACSTTGADTKVELFEEGDYEVALDYEIKNDSTIDTYTNYQIYFTFKIRNANCMVYPFDLVTGGELSDNALTENGFKLDLARSRYLLVNITRDAVKKVNGRFSLDTRVNTATQDGKEYKDEGIYTFTVKNPTTGDSTTKTIYVGSNPIYKALAKGDTLDHINELIAEGGILQEDGSILKPTPTPEPTSTPTPVPTATSKPDKNAVTSKPEPTKSEANNGITSSDIKADNEANEKEGKKSSVWIIVVIVTVISVGVVLFLLFGKKKKGVTISESELEDTGNSEE